MNVFELITIDKRSNTPISDQLVMSIYHLINNTQLLDSTMMPTPLELKEYFNISLTDVLTAYQALIDNRFIVKQDEQYKVSYLQINQSVYSKDNSLEQTISKFNKKPSYKTIYMKEIQPTQDFYDNSLFPKSEKIVSVKRVFFADEIPLYVSTTYISLNVVPNFMDIFDHEKLFVPFYKEHLNLKETNLKRRIKVAVLNDEDAKLLNDISGTATHFSSYRYFNQNDQMFAYAEVVTSSHYGFTIDIKL